MPSRDESWARLTDASWLSSGPMQQQMKSQNATPQRTDAGIGSFIYDEYTMRISKLPPSLRSEALIYDFCDNPNRAVNNGGFNTINIFNRRTPGQPPKLGDIYDIDLLGPVNGSVMIVEMSSDFGVSTDPNGAYFDVQVVTTSYGDLPERGAREFGIDTTGGVATFYTRGLSRARNVAMGVFGKAPQQLDWIFAMKGIRDRVRAAGGQADQDPGRFYKVVPPNTGS